MTFKIFDLRTSDDRFTDAHQEEAKDQWLRLKLFVCKRVPLSMNATFTFYGTKF